MHLHKNSPCGCQQFVHKYYGLVRLGLALEVVLGLVVIFWKKEIVLLRAQSAI